jgi:ubiquinone biosynthesis monooxygenase Coq7
MSRASPVPQVQTLADGLIRELDRALRTVIAGNVAQRDYPAESVPDSDQDPESCRRGAALMRVNHAGEVAAQALYHGQALTARDPEVRETLLAAARDETDHLAWCERRVRELGGRTSVLGPIWYAGSFVIGALAGLAGDRNSLGFVAETERQVTEHLESHLELLPASDARSRALVEQMRHDEARHGHEAHEAGARPLPALIRGIMRNTARIMTRSAYWW